MATQRARKALKSNLEEPLSADQAICNLSKAILEMTRAVDELDAKICHLTSQVTASVVLLESTARLLRQHPHPSYVLELRDRLYNAFTVWCKRVAK